MERPDSFVSQPVPETSAVTEVLNDGSTESKEAVGTSPPRPGSPEAELKALRLELSKATVKHAALVQEAEDERRSNPLDAFARYDQLIRECNECAIRIGEINDEIVFETNRAERAQ